MIALIQIKLSNKATSCLLKRATGGQMMTNDGEIQQNNNQGQADPCHCQYVQYGQLEYVQEE